MNISDQDLEQRIEKCRRILDDDPGSLIFAALADCYRKTGRLTDAAGICRQGLKLHPDYGSGHLVMSKIYLTAGDYQSARQHLVKARRLMGATRSIELLECELSLRMGEIESGRKRLSMLKQLDPENSAVTHLEELMAELDNQDNIQTGGPVQKPPEEDSPVRRTEPVKKEDADVDKTSDRALSPDLMLQALGKSLSSEYILALSYDGRIISTFPRGKSELDNSIAFSKMVINGLNHCLPSVGMGQMQTVLVETENRKVFLKDTGSFILMLESADKVNLGVITLKLSEMMPHLIYQE